MFTKILVPIDLADTDISANAVKKAVALARAGNGAVRVIYVRSILPVSFMEYVPPDFDSKEQADCEARLGEIAAAIDLPEDRVSSAVRMGGVYPEVLAEAKDWGADLVVVGSHRPSMSSYLLGSNATAIVRHATCSVLVSRA